MDPYHRTANGSPKSSSKAVGAEQYASVSTTSAKTPTAAAMMSQGRICEAPFCGLCPPVVPCSSTPVPASVSPRSHGEQKLAAPWGDETKRRAKLFLLPGDDSEEFDQRVHRRRQRQRFGDRGEEAILHRLRREPGEALHEFADVEFGRVRRERA